MTFLKDNGRFARSANALFVTAALSVAAAGCHSSGSVKLNQAAVNSSASPTAIPTQEPPVTEGAASAPTAATTASAGGAATQAHPASAQGEVLLDGGAVVLPDRARTPGATNPQVTQANIHSTVCRTGFTATIRPPSSYTTTLKEEQLATGYAYHGDMSTSDYEEDHLISLELGGAPSDSHNLWPEPYAATDGARVKDRIENKLHDLVCSGALTLAVAQQAISDNWWDAYQRYGGEGSPTVWDGAYGASTGPAPTPTSQATSAPATSAPLSSDPAGATAQCNDGTYSYSQHRSGTCSHHGGVARWINPPPS